MYRCLINQLNKRLNIVNNLLSIFTQCIVAIGILLFALHISHWKQIILSGYRYLGYTKEIEWEKSISPYSFMLETTLMYCNVIYLLLNVHNNACQYK